jgi:hypothetical protein
MQAILPKINISETVGAEKLHLKISWKFLLALFALMICTGELHEQIHIQTGRIVCGDYGERDFNAWKTAADCAAPAWRFLATLAGPLWSFAVMWTGVFLLTKAKSLDHRAIGFALIFAPLPFARIFTALTGGGDEKTVLAALFKDDLNLGTIKIIAAAIVSLICLPPMLIAFRHIKNRFAVLYVAGFAVLPLVVLGLYIFNFLNPLLAGGFLSSAPFLGTPLLIIIHFLIMAVLFVIFRKWLLEIAAERV